MDPLGLLEYPALDRLANASDGKQLIHLLRLDLHADQQRGCLFREGVEHLLNKERVNVRDVRKLIDAQEVEAGVVGKLAVQCLAVSGLVEP